MGRSFEIDKGPQLLTYILADSLRDRSCWKTQNGSLAFGIITEHQSGHSLTWLRRRRLNRIHAGRGSLPLSVRVSGLFIAKQKSKNVLGTFANKKVVRRIDGPRQTSFGPELKQPAK